MGNVPARGHGALEDDGAGFFRACCPFDHLHGIAILRELCTGEDLDALPGLDAIHAALHPARTDALYFVSKGDGTHHFSATLEEHNAAVKRYQLKKRN